MPTPSPTAPRRLRARAVLAAVGALVAGTRPARAQEPPQRPAGERRYPAGAVRADLAHLYTTLQGAHYDLYAHRSRAAYDARYRETLAAVDRPMTRLEVVRLFMPFVAFGGFGHTRVEFPGADYGPYLAGGGTLLPFDVRIRGGRTFVAHSYTDAVRPGDELVALDGRTAATWVARLGRYLAVESPYQRDAHLENFFPRLLWLDQGQLDSVRVVLRRDRRDPPRGAGTGPAGGHGTDTTFAIATVDGAEVERRKTAWETAPHARRAEVLAGGIAYLRPGPFYAAHRGESLASFDAFVDSAFRRVLAAGVSNLVLDLRENPGGDNSFSDPMVAWFATRPFRFASDYRLKASPVARQALTRLAAEYPGGISAQMLEAMRGRADGERFAFPIPEVQPRPGARFTGRVWALVDRHTNSNATAVAAIVQDYGFATVLGEETSDVPAGYGSIAQFTLPNTGIGVTYPKSYFVRPSGTRAARGVAPTHRIERPVVPTSRDVVLDEAVAYVRSQRP
jgi:hypothetical protein